MSLNKRAYGSPKSILKTQKPMSKILSKSVHNKTTVTVVLSCDYNGSKYNNCLSYITENIVGETETHDDVTSSACSIMSQRKALHIN